MKFEYKQKNIGKELILGYGFDPQEIFRFKFVFDVCLQHGEIYFELDFLGGMLELMYFRGGFENEGS